MITVGSATIETAEEAGYVSVERINPTAFVLTDANGKRELFAGFRNMRSGWQIRHGKLYLEFVRTISKP